MWVLGTNLGLEEQSAFLTAELTLSALPFFLPLFLFLLSLRFIFLLCVIWLYLCMCTTYMPDAHRGQKRLSDSLELELGVVSHNLSAENWLYKSSRTCREFRSHLSSPCPLLRQCFLQPKLVLNLLCSYRWSWSPDLNCLYLLGAAIIGMCCDAQFTRSSNIRLGHFLIKVDYICVKDLLPSLLLN